MRVKTKCGIVEGYEEKGLILFKGIPFARAERFCAPEEVKWDGVLDASSFQSMACQSIDLAGQSEDCLNLNIYTPDVSGKLPVLVEIHGGAFQNGSNQKMDPFHVVGKDQFVYVTMNYRLGVLGYLYLGEAYPTSGNNGTLDQLACLKWVHENIAAFGGDPKRVTLMGSSAGAKAMGALMSIPVARDYFQQVIMISGASQSVRSIATAKKVTDQYLALAGVKRVEDLACLPVQQILQAQKALCSGPGSTCLFGPVADGQVIATDFYEQIHRFTYWRGKALIGSSEHELVYYKMMDPNFVTHASDIAQALFGRNAAIAIEDANSLMATMSPADAWVKVLSDYMYRTYSYRLGRLLSQQGSIVYQYSTAFAPAMHCMDHILGFGARTKLETYFPDPNQHAAAVELGQQIRQTFLAFVMDGRPDRAEWQSLDQAQVQLVWDQHVRVEALDQKVCDRFPDEVFVL